MRLSRENCAECQVNVNNRILDSFLKCLMHDVQIWDLFAYEEVFVMTLNVIHL